MVGNFIFSNGKRIVVAIKQVKPFLYILYAYAVMRIVCTGMLAVVAGKQNTLVCLCDTYVDVRIFPIAYTVLERILQQRDKEQGRNLLMRHYQRKVRPYT